MTLKEKLINILAEVDEYRESPLDAFADEIIQLFEKENGGGEKVQVENSVSPEILTAVEYGYRQCEKGNSLHQALVNAKG